MTYLEEYAQLVQRKEVVAGVWIKRELERLLDDLENPDYEYDTEYAHKRMRFQESLCLQSKAPYFGKPLELMPWQKAFWEALYSFKLMSGERRFTEALLEVARKNGKALALDTRIPTPHGDRIMRDIQPGMFVYGPGGTPVKVLAVSDVFLNHKCYEVEFEDGEIIVADAGHLWEVTEKRAHGKGRTVKTTEELSRDYMHLRKDGTGKELKYRVDLPAAIQRPESRFPIAPYILGVWLGDGLSASMRVSCGAEDADSMKANIEAAGGACKIHEYGKTVLLGLSNFKKGHGKNSIISTAFRNLHLYNNKHIPEMYFYGSAQQREDLLKGLMDTDGTVSKAGQCEFVQKSERLTRDVSRLLASLGIKHSVKAKIATCNGKRIPVYRILFYVDREHTCFKLARKTARLKSSLSKRMGAKSIERITETKSVPTKCLCVEGGLYLCGDRNTITHNSTMFAADGFTDLFLGEGGSDICCASNDDRQAKLIWKEIAGMRGRLDPKKALTRQTLTELENKARGITVFRLSSKTQNKDGYNISKTYLDESHDIAEENGQSEIAEACWRGMSSKEEPLFMNCTTQGFNRDCYLDHKIAYAKKVIDGEIDDDRFLPWLYEQDSEQEIWQDESSWEKSNPSIRYGVKKVGKLRRDVELAKADKATRIHMLTKDFNIPQSSAQAWLMLEDYDYPTDEINLDSFRGSFYLGAVDLSATTDLSNAKVLMMVPGQKEKYILSHYWIPESKLQDSDDKEAGALYKEWARDGYVTIHEGNEIDISAIADWFYLLYKEHKLKPLKIGYDQRFSKTFLDRCEDYGFETERLEQGRNLSGAMKLTEADLKSRIINYGGNPVDKWCLANTCCEVDNVGNIQPRKVPGQNAKRIDGGVTLIMVEEVYRRYRNEFSKAIGG